MNVATLSTLKRSHFISLMGQSNAVGYNSLIPDTHLYNPQAGQYIFDNVAMQWQPLQQNKNNAGKPYTYLGYQGVELTLMQLLKDYYGMDQYLFKYAEGATSLAVNLSAPPYDWNNLSANPYMYNGCVANFNEAIASFPAQLPAMKVLIWMQGESDAANNIMANQYQSNFESFIAALKNKWNLPNLKILQVLLSDTQTNIDNTLKSIVNTAKVNLSIDGNKYVNTDGAETYGGFVDAIHYSTTGYADIARRIFNVLITML